MSKQTFQPVQLAQVFAPLVDLIFPPRCPACGEGLSSQEGLCSGCWGELVIPGEPCCTACQRPFGEQGPDEGGLCAPCMADPPRHDGVAAATLYNDLSRKLVLGFKHGRKISLARMMARLISARLPAEVGPGWIFVPVPLHRWRLWHRGYNQAALLAGELARLRGGILLVDGLERVKATPSLGGMGKKARARTLSGAIEVRLQHKAAVKGARIVLVDDVLTSGATTSACVGKLKQAGGEQVRIACFARVMDEALDL